MLLTVWTERWFMYFPQIKEQNRQSSQLTSDVPYAMTGDYDSVNALFEMTDTVAC